MKTTVNDVTLFSNGIGHFRRTYTVPAGKDELITIPFKTDYIGDVAASLQVFGKVRLVEPPSFTPANSNATSLNIDQQNAVASLLTQLSGALISIFPANRDAVENCFLVGVEKHKEAASNGSVFERDYVVFMKDGKVARLDLHYVENIQFNDDTVRTEIDKALKMNFQRIKPDSTLLDLKLSAKDTTDAVVQYTIPVAAWKMRYAIRQDKGAFTLEGAAIIDNNTDEDWDNFRISVVTGNPISFNTDIAQVVVPRRKFVRLVDDIALGNVDVEEGTQIMAAATPKSRSLRAAVGAKMSVSNYADFGLESFAAEAGEMSPIYTAEAPGVESKEVGDFCVFTSKEPITILARKSAVVPMFTVVLEHAGVVLLYKESNHARRPYRAIKFRNETKDTLGKGKTVIYNEGVFSGECVLDTAKPGENRMLPHCIENGVKIVKQTKGLNNQRTSVKISDGVGVNETLSTATCVYEIDNKKDEPFKLALEHEAILNDPRGEWGVSKGEVQVFFEGVEIAEQEKLTTGWRFYFEIGPKQKLTVKIKETMLRHQEIKLGDLAYIFSCVNDGVPLKENATIERCIDLQEQIDLQEEQREELKDRRKDLTEQANRVRNNIQAVGQQGNITAWVTDLDATEKEIRKIETESIPEIKRKLQDLKRDLMSELKKIDLAWEAVTPV